EALGVSRTMIHYIKTGRHSPSLKLTRQVAELEQRLSQGQGKHPGKAAPRPITASSGLGGQEWQRLGWLESLRRRWRRRVADRDQITLGIKILFPDDADQILEWIKR